MYQPRALHHPGPNDPANEDTGDFFGMESEESAIPLEGEPSYVAPGETPPPSRKIKQIDQRLVTGSRHEDKWNRTPNVTGQGAIHVKSFHAKLTGESLAFLDEQINEWLDAHPQYEVKMVTSSVGEWAGKTKEPNLIVQVWV